MNTTNNAIKSLYQKQPVLLYKPYIPLWQKEEVRCREAATNNNPSLLLDYDRTIKELEVGFY
jgi:hypothetical protein